MEYLKAFVIGSSGLVIFPVLSNLLNDNRYDYSKIYSFIIPIYYGLLSILTLFIKKQFKLSLQYSLLIVSVISIMIIQLINHYFNDKYYINSKQNNLFLIIQDIIRQLIIFNIIIFYLTINFSKSEILKYFIIGSSIFSYYITYYLVYKGKNINYDYNKFAITEPFVQGFFLAIGIYIGIHYLHLNLISSIILYKIISSFPMTFIAHKLKLYNLNTKEWIYKYHTGGLVLSLIKSIILYYLIIKLK